MVTKNLCECDVSKKRFAIILFSVTMLLIIHSAFVYFKVLGETKQWLNKKMELKNAVKGIEKQLTAPRPMTPEEIEQEKQRQEYVDQVKNVSFGNEKSAHLFVMDYGGNIYFHGKSSHLNSDTGTALDIDTPHNGYTPISDMIRVAKKGGGFVYFKWKKDRPMISYSHPSNKSDLILVGVLPMTQRKYSTPLKTDVSLSSSSEPKMEKRVGPLSKLARDTNVNKTFYSRTDPMAMQTLDADGIPLQQFF